MYQAVFLHAEINKHTEGSYIVDLSGKLLAYM